MDLDQRWKEIEKARRLLGLPPKTSRIEIQEAYRKKCREIHPDHTGKRDLEEELQRINSAYRLLMDFADRYQMDLTKNEDGMTDEEWWFHHFGSDPVWGRTRGG
ncbi:hypothetical protein DBT_0038 [Dissulfuribacter thermophilus]|uniref:J domain-containing protein n=1 Tax=Dissulfuribacter thermophilus TaxID=1156395 RepID=A0A1B9F8X2_9BACT|nr:J domain-containing protein [Dissulfuribacter thermophilus]OCC16221.1 hypothetical protein DBT_0038 [Dissulfuribacter thermophilus]